MCRGKLPPGQVSPGSAVAKFGVYPGPGVRGWGGVGGEQLKRGWRRNSAGLGWASSLADRKHEVTFSGFDFVGIWLREHLEFERIRTLRIASHEFTVLA